MACKVQTTDAHIRVIDYSKNAFEYKSHHYGLTETKLEQHCVYT